MSVNTTATRGATRIATPRRAPNPVHATLILSVILVCQLMVVLDATIVNVALPNIQHALNFSPSGLSWVLNAYTLTFGGLLLLGARAGDLLGRKNTFLAGISLFTLASLAGGFAGNSAELLTARAVQGIGGALAAPAALAMLTTMFAEGRERVRAVGLYTAVSIGGSAVGLVAGGMLTEWFTWRWVLFVNVPIGIALVIVARAVLPATARQTGRFDLAGAVTSTLGMSSLVFGFVHAASSGWANSLTVGSFVAGIVLLAAFIVNELRAPSPITPLRLFADRTRVVSYVARLLLMGGTMGVFFYLTQYLQDVLHYSSLRTGIGFLPLTAALFAASQLSARVLVERIGARLLISTGVVFATAGLFWLTQLTQNSSYLDVLGPLLLLGVGNGIAFVPLTSASLAGVQPADAGAGSGLINVMQQVGGSLGLAVLVTVASAGTHGVHLPAGASPAEVTQLTFLAGAHHAFYAAAIFLLATLVLVSTLIRSRGRSGAETQVVTVIE